LLGRIVEAGRRTSRVLLLTDVNSRVTVLIGTNQVRAIMTGDNSAFPRITMLPQEASLDHGEEIVTSGIGGMFPRGLKLGVVDLRNDGPRVRIDATLGDLEFVSVLLYENPGLALSRELKPDSARAGNGTARGGRH
jgi:rod shape-determining protein MreC